MASLKTVDHGVVYRNPEPQRVSEYVVFPRLVALPDDTLLCMCRHGTAKESADGRIKIHRSTDGGKTWAPAAALPRPHDYAVGAEDTRGLMVMPDGETLACVSVQTRVDTRVTYLFRSDDGGRSWSPPAAVMIEPFGKFAMPGQIIALPDGTLIATGEGSGDGVVVAEDKYAALITRSADGGRSWDPVVTAHVSENPYYFDMNITQLRGGQLLAAYWTHDRRTEQGLNVHMAQSPDCGCTWTDPTDALFWGQRTEVLQLASGRVLAATNYRRRPLGIRILLSDIDTATFDQSEHLEIWGIEPAQVHSAPVPARQQDVVEGVLDAHHHFTFGFPAITQLSDGTVVVVFYVTEESVTYVRCSRLVECE